MASHMVVPPSRDTLFFRGFSGRRDIQDIREYFERQAGCTCTVEFFKQDEMNDALYVALKFESREIAKDILTRFDDTEVMGDRIELSWFKDLRKAKQQQALERQQRYGNMYGNYNRRYPPYHRRSPMSRGRYQQSRDRSHSRSASRSRSRSYSRSPSPRRSRDKRRSERGASSSSRSSSPDQNKSSSSKVRSKVQPSEKQDEVSPMKKMAAEEMKAPHSPDDRSPGRQSARSQDVKPSPQVRRDQSEERKVSRMSVETDGLKAKRDEDRLSRMDDLKSRMEENEEKTRAMLLEQQRMRQRQIEMDKEERRRKESGSEDPLSRRAAPARPLSPGMSLDRPTKDEERGRGGGSMGNFWDELEETASKGKGSISGKNASATKAERLRSAMMDDDDFVARDRSTGMRGGLDDDDRFYGLMERRSGGLSRAARDFDFSQDAMALIQEKKKEIERVYKNDCETFVTVVKMLISKEPSLEERLQYSLRENLKEIGQRCILDLREYMDRLREHDK